MADQGVAGRRRGFWWWSAAAGLVGAVIPLTLWAVPAIHPQPTVRVTWADNGGDQVSLWCVRRGLDRHGYVHQEQLRVWNGPTAALAAVRAADHAADLRPARSWRFQYTQYGHNHVVLRQGLSLTEDGVIRTLPYSLVAAILAAPALVRGIAATGRRLRWRAMA